MCFLFGSICFLLQLVLDGFLQLIVSDFFEFCFEFVDFLLLLEVLVEVVGSVDLLDVAGDVLAWGCAVLLEVSLDGFDRFGLRHALDHERPVCRRVVHDVDGFVGSLDVDLADRKHERVDDPEDEHPGFLGGVFCEDAVVDHRVYGDPVSDALVAEKKVGLLVAFAEAFGDVRDGFDDVDETEEDRDASEEDDHLEVEDVAGAHVCELHVVAAESELSEVGVDSAAGTERLDQSRLFFGASVGEVFPLADFRGVLR